ncbi:hypothetical protein Y88_1145 [Novosphingobium nitrogenifigens DSM 19370]|uniref:O-antigen ligase-related domain-containing protein n=1 Tax=Novosphingobium nitrogenifigens DSM 19370 TaxID=983920 RepID=F1Z8E2_9SPHN|nr:O-antigen ligase family protein [Novosphingobium nitrogenifigens]EGD59083.1 hypothetical protein Y88_1145 [Novosphingobium nitrogenifigens DSM 19370]
MDSPADHPDDLAEVLISRTIQCTWIFYAVGALYMVGPALGWTLAAMAAWRLYIAPALPVAQRPQPVPMAVKLWLGGMTGMLVVLIVGHSLNTLGAAQTIKSATGWAKGWALLGLYPFAGAVLDIRASVIYRAICRLGLQTICLMPLFMIAPLAGLPGLLYVSPLSVLGGSGPEFFAVTLYIIDPENGASRWQFYAPWAPAAGMVAVVHMICALQERRPGWKVVGLLANVMISYFSQSRMAILATAIIWPVAILVARLNRPRVWFALAPIVLAIGVFGNTINDMIDKAVQDFQGARADSSRVRAALGRIAVQRWRDEAPWFGHGIVERGPHMVEFMPIGSHHSWYGLLFVKGLLGVICLAVPLIASTASIALQSMRSRDARTAFAMLLVLLFYSFGENLEVLGYLIWPGLLIIGIGSQSRDRISSMPPAPAES